VLKRIGRYEIQAELGRGGFGRVFRAFDPTVRRLVAIKMLNAETGERDTLIRFRNEAAAAGKLQHGNIVTIHDFGEQDGTPYIVMELLDGEDLQRVITGKRPLDLLAKVQIMSQIAQGLHYAHRHGIIHRDVKPANVMLLANGGVKIMDFGIALLTQTTGSRLTPLGSVVGTFRYMAPEQFMGSSSDLLSDIFSYGVIYYELVTGRHPFEAPEPARVMFQVMQVEPAPIREFCPECPDPLQAVVSRLLSKDRGSRYQTLEDVEFDVGPVLLDLKRARATSLLRQARDALAGERVDTAQGLVREILDLDPAHPGARELRESVQAQLHRRAVLPRVNALLKSGQEHLQARHYPEALRDFESALRLDEMDSNIHALIEQARTAMEQARRVESLLSDASDALARQDLSAAYRSATVALQAEPQNPRAAALLQTIRQQIDQRDREQRLRDSLIRAKGSVMLQAFDEAIDLLVALEIEFPDSTEVGKLLQRARSEKEASERQQRLFTGMSEAKNMVRTRRFADAVAALQSLASEFPDTPAVHELLAYAQDEMLAQERTEAVDRVTREARALLEKESYGEALEALHGALQSYPGDPELLRLSDQAATGKIRYERSRALRSALETGNLMRSRRAFADALQALDRFSGKYGKEPEIDNTRRQIEAEWKSDQRMEAVRNVLDQARDLIKQGRASAATQILTQATVQYPGEQELTSLLEAAHEAARDQQRAGAVRQICEQARALLLKEQFDAALEALDGGLAAYAGEESLTRLRASAIAARSERERQAAREKTLERCKELRRQNAYGEALRALEAALRIFPGDRELSALQQAIELDWAVQKRLNAVRETREKVQDLIENGLFEQAIALTADRIREYPDEPELTALSDLAKRRLQDRQKSEAVTRVASEAMRLAQAKAFTQSLEILQRGLESYPGEESLMRLRDSVAALSAKEEVLKRCRELYRQARHAEALEAIEAALHDYPSEAELQTLKLQTEQGAALQQRQETIQAALRYTQDLLQREHFDEAISAISATLARYPDSTELSALREKACTLMEEKRRRDEVQGILSQAQSLMQSRQLDRALGILAEGLKAYPAEPSLSRLQEGVIAARADAERRQVRNAAVVRCTELHRQGRFAEASEAIEHALRGFPQDAELAELKEKIARDWTRQKRLREIENAMREAARLAVQGFPGRAIALLEPLSGDAPAESGVERLLAQCRTQLKAKNREDLLHSVGILSAEQRIQDAIRKIDDAVATHDVENDAELIELRTRLDFELQQRERSLRRERDLAALEDISVRIATERKVRSLLDKAQSLAQLYSGDAEFQQRLATISAQAQQRATRPVTASRKRLVFIAAALLVLLIGGFSLYRIFQRPGLVTFEVHTDPSGATVRVGQTTCVTPNCSLRLQPGTYDVEAHLDGFQPSRVSMRVTKGAAHSPLEIRLQPSAPLVAEAHNTDQPGGVPPEKPAPKRDAAGAAVQTPKPTFPKPLADAPRADSIRPSNPPLSPQPGAHFALPETPPPALPPPPVIAPSGTEPRLPDPSGNSIKPSLPVEAEPKAAALPPPAANPPQAIHPPDQHASGPGIQPAIAANSRAMDLYSGKLYEEAIVGFTEAIRLWPDFANAYFNRGVAYYKLGQFKEAISDFDRTLTLNPQNEKAAVQKQEAQKRLASGVYFAGKDVTSPAYVSWTNPKYSKEAIRAGKTGTVLLTFVVNEYGLVKDCHVLRSLTPDLDQRAIDAATHAKFKPGTKHGKPVPVEVTVEVKFDQP